MCTSTNTFNTLALSILRNMWAYKKINIKIIPTMSILFKSLSQPFIICFSRILVCPYYHIFPGCFTSIFKTPKFTHTYSLSCLCTYVLRKPNMEWRRISLFTWNQLHTKRFNLVGCHHDITLYLVVLTHFYPYPVHDQLAHKVIKTIY